LSNAIKFTPEAGSIKLTTRFISEEDGVCKIGIKVEDTGIGISEEQQKLLFRKFQQADSRISRKFGGTGLGLAISKNIVEMMGGKMKVESEFGKGSAFSFYFNAARGTKKPVSLSETGVAAIEGAIGARQLEEDKTAENSGIFEGYKILLAEDVEINQEIIDTLIEPTLLKMDCVMNGVEAVAMFEKSPDDYDLILMDVQMPDMDGYEATQKIRAVEADRKASGLKMKIPNGVPIIAMTANVFREDIDKCLEVGMNDHIGKPIDVQEFFNALKKYLL